MSTSSRLNVGCGIRPLLGYVNVDLERYDGVDYSAYEFRQIDVRDCEFAELALRCGPWETIRADQFLEHLTVTEGLGFLRFCRQVLRPSGRLWLSVPDWGAHTRDYIDRQQRVPLATPSIAAGPFRPEVNVMLSTLFNWGPLQGP